MQKRTRIRSVPKSCGGADNVQYLRLMNAVLDEIYAENTERGYSLAELSRQSGVSYSQVRAIYWRQIALPLFRTIWRLSRAVGFELVISLNAGKTRALLRRVG